MKKKSAKGKHGRWADHYTDKAKKENYPARSVYKLREIQNKTRLLRPGDAVLDLGCAPGSWLLYSAEVVGEKGRVVGVDLNPVDIGLPDHAEAMTGDVFDMDDTLREAVGAEFDVVMSDMAPNTTGIKDVDALRSAGLCEAAIAVADEVLKPDGNFVCKIFQGAEFDSVMNTIKRKYAKQKTYKPESTRKASREIFIIGMGKKPTS